MTRVRKLRRTSTEDEISTFEVEWSTATPPEWHTSTVQISGLGTPDAALVPQEFDPPLPLEVLNRLAAVIEQAAAIG